MSATRSRIAWLPPVAAGLIAVLVGFTSSAIIIFQAAEAAGATHAEVGSWILALSIGMALTSIGPSLYYRKPVLTAWSTPGAALLAVSLSGVSMSDAIGAFVFCGLLITLFGWTGWFERAISKIPLPLASAMLVGILLRFGLDVFVAMTTQPALVGAMFIAYLLLKRYLPRYSVILVLVLGVLWSAGADLLHAEAIELTWALPHFVWPSFNLTVLIGVGLPLFVVTMASQNVPGVAVMRAAGYDTPISPLITTTGVATVLLAPFGGFAFNLAAITAAICLGPEAHEDPQRRYLASVAAGGWYLLAGLMGATVVSLFAAFPRELVMAMAGLALLSTIAGGLTTAMAEPSQREAALITLLVTASGISLLGIGSAFWGLVAGGLSLVLLRPRG